MGHDNEMIDAIGSLTHELAAAVTYQLRLARNRQSINNVILMLAENGIKSFALPN